MRHVVVYYNSVVSLQLETENNMVRIAREQSVQDVGEDKKCIATCSKDTTLHPAKIISLIFTCSRSKQYTISAG